MVILEDRYLTGAYVLKLTDLTFEVIESGREENMTQADGSVKKNLILPIKLSNGKVKEWIPNETSKKKLRSYWGDDTEKWVGKKAKLEMAKQNIRGEMKDVIFVK